MHFDVITNLPDGTEKNFPVHCLPDGTRCICSQKKVLIDEGTYLRVFAQKKPSIESASTGENDFFQEVRPGDFICQYVRKNGTLFINSYRVEEVTATYARCIWAIL